MLKIEMKEEPLDIKPDLRKLKKEMEEIEIIGEVKRIPSLSHNNVSLILEKNIER